MRSPTEERLLEVVERFEGKLPTDIIEEVRSLVVHREWGVALENLCQELFEYSIVVEPEALQTIQDLAKQMNLSPKTWSFLAP